MKRGGHVSSNHTQHIARREEKRSRRAELETKRREESQKKRNVSDLRFTGNFSIIPHLALQASSRCRSSRSTYFAHDPTGLARQALLAMLLQHHPKSGYTPGVTCSARESGKCCASMSLEVSVIGSSMIQVFPRSTRVCLLSLVADPAKTSPSLRAKRVHHQPARWKANLQLLLRTLLRYRPPFLSRWRRATGISKSYKE